MPVYSFQERFVPFVKDGSKQRTVRAYRKDGKLPVIGQFVYLFYAMRTKYCTRLNKKYEHRLTDFRTIFISEPVNMITPGSIYLMNGHLQKADAEQLLKTGEYKTDERFVKLVGHAADCFAWLDGFRPEGSTPKNPKGSFELMYRFWMQTHELPFTGTVSYW